MAIRLAFDRVKQLSPVIARLSGDRLRSRMDVSRDEFITHAKAGNLPAIDRLLAAGLDVDASDEFGFTMLMEAAELQRSQKSERVSSRSRSRKDSGADVSRSSL